LDGEVLHEQEEELVVRDCLIDAFLHFASPLLEQGERVGHFAVRFAPAAALCGRQPRRELPVIRNICLCDPPHWIEALLYRLQQSEDLRSVDEHLAEALGLPEDRGDTFIDTDFQQQDLGVGLQRIRRARPEPHDAPEDIERRKRAIRNNADPRIETESSKLSAERVLTDMDRESSRRHSTSGVDP
jgi:hypothetical protein